MALISGDAKRIGDAFSGALVVGRETDAHMAVVRTLIWPLIDKKWRAHDVGIKSRNTGWPPTFMGTIGYSAGEHLVVRDYERAYAVTEAIAGNRAAAAELRSTAPRRGEQRHTIFEEAGSLMGDAPAGDSGKPAGAFFGGYLHLCGAAPKRIGESLINPGAVAQTLAIVANRERAVRPPSWQGGWRPRSCV
jgi:hypothetical protein